MLNNTRINTAQAGQNPLYLGIAYQDWDPSAGRPPSVNPLIRNNRWGMGARRRGTRFGTVEVRNQGDQPAPASVLRFFLSTDAALDANDQLLRAVTVGALDPGEIRPAVLFVPLPRGTSASGRFDLAASCRQASLG